MANDVGVFIEGALKLEQQFDRFPRAAHANILARFHQFMPRLAALVRSQVPRKTGKLASEVTESVKDSPDRISGRVGFSADFAKAGAIEYRQHRQGVQGARP
jgi:hypothetical protein